MKNSAASLKVLESSGQIDMESQKELVDRLISLGYLKTQRVIDAMLEVRRDVFVPDEAEKYAYVDTPLSIGHGQTVSAPHMVAIMCENADLEEDQNVLEIGGGSGYHSCITSKITGVTVYAVERLEKLAETARMNLERAGCDKVHIMVGDGTLGYEDKAPYDRIIVTAGAPDVPPPLLDQLKTEGKLLIPVGSRSSQELLRITKKEGTTITERLGGCVFVPLIGRYGWSE